MKARLFFSALIAIVLVLLLTGGVGAYWLATNSPVTLLQDVEQSSPQASVFISQQSPVVVSLLVNPDRLIRHGLISTPLDQRRQVQAKWRQLRQAVLDRYQLNYSREIQPWLGDELTFAVTTPDLDRDSSNGLQPGYLMVATTEKPEQAQRSIQTYWQKRAAAGVDLVFEQYAGVNILSGSEKKTEDPSLATAMVGDRFVLFANHPKVLRDAVNNLQVPELSLGNSEVYQQSVQRLSDPHVGVVFVHLPQLTAWSDRTKPTEPKLTEPGQILASPRLDSLVMAFQVDTQSLTGDVLLLAAPGQSIEPAQPSVATPVQAVQHIPATSPLVVAGKDLRQLWSRMEQGLEGYDPLKSLLDKPLDTLQQRWGIDLQQDVFDWLEGEYALGLFPQNSAQPDWIFVTEQSSATLDGLAHLDAIAQQQGISVGTFTIADQPVTAWTKLSTVAATVASANTSESSKSRQRPSLSIRAEVQGVHTTIDNFEIFTTSLDAMAEAIQAAQNSLAATELFQHALAPLAFPNDGYLYVTGETLQNLVEPLLGSRSANSAIQPFLNAVRSFTISSYGSTTDAVQAVVLVQL